MKLRSPWWVFFGAIVLFGVAAYLYGRSVGTKQECEAVNLHGVVIWSGDCSDLPDHRI